MPAKKVVFEHNGRFYLVFEGARRFKISQTENQVGAETEEGLKPKRKKFGK